MGTLDSKRPCPTGSHQWLENQCERYIVCRVCGLKVTEEDVMNNLGPIKSKRRDPVKDAEREWYIETELWF